MNLRKHLLVLITVGLAVGFSSCMRSCGGGRAAMSPEDVVQAYLDIVFNMEDVSQRDDLLEYSTGSLADAIASASDDSIREGYIEPRYQLERYTVIERRDRTPRETEITFEIVFKNLAKEGDETQLKPEEIPTVKVENTVSVVREKKTWKISDVLSKKSSFIFPVSPESTQIRAKAVPE